MAAGGSASVFGYSSGAVLALKAAASGLPITKLALYEPPFRADDSYPALPSDLAEQLATLVSAGRRGDAVELYQTKAVGIPQEVVAQLRHAPFRQGLVAIAHMLLYDATIIGDPSLPAELISSVVTPTLVISGEQSSPFHARRSTSSRGLAAQWAALQSPRPEPRHQPGSHSARLGGVPRRLAQYDGCLPTGPT